MLNLLCPLSLDSSYGFLRLSVVLFYHRSFFIVHSLSLLPTSSAGGCLRQYKNRNILYSSDFLFYRTCCLLYFVMLHLCPQEHLTLLAKTAVYWLFSQNNRSMEANHLFRILLSFWCVLCTETKQVKKSPPKCFLRVSNQETRFFGRKKIFAVLVVKRKKVSLDI